MLRRGPAKQLALGLLCWLLRESLCAPETSKRDGAKATGLKASSGPQITYNGTHLHVYGDGNTTFDPTSLTSLELAYNSTKHIGLHGLVLPDALPASWSGFVALRSLLIDCAPSPLVDAAGGPPAGAAAANGTATTRYSARFGTQSQLASVKEMVKFKQGSTLHSLSIINCGMEGGYGTVWSTYLSGVPLVNLSGNALTGGFTSLDDFEEVCTPDFAGDDYDPADCSSPTLRWLDVSRNNLTGGISTGAALGDDITDALCSTACLTIVLAAGVTRPDVLCTAPLVVFAQSNPGLRYRRSAHYASGYVMGDKANWCFEPESRAVLPAMWGVFGALLLGTLMLTLYARSSLKRVPYRMNPPAFEVLLRGAGAGLGPGSGGTAASHADPLSLARSPGGKGGGGRASAGGYVGLAGGAVELAERPLIPKGQDLAGLGPEPGPGGGADRPMGRQAHHVSWSGAAAGPDLPVSVSPPSATEMAGGRRGGKAAAVGKSGSGGRRGADGMRVALTGGLVDSAEHGGSAWDPEADLGRDSDTFNESDLDPGQGRGPGPTLASRSSLGGMGGGGGGGGVAGTGGDAAPGSSRWRAAAWRVALWGWDVLCMELRTLLILGMFGLECYWAYSLILYRGGWQLLVLVPNYLEHTLAGVAILRAFMTGTHGRWKYVAAIPGLSFTLASVYLCYGFVAYPFGWADVGPLSWEKFIDLMDSCGVLSSTCWAIFSSLAYWRGNSVETSYQYFNTDIFVGMMLMCFTDLLSTAHHLAATLQVPLKQWLRKEFDVRRVVPPTDKSCRLGVMAGDSDL